MDYMQVLCRQNSYNYKMQRGGGENVGFGDKNVCTEISESSTVHQNY